MKNRVLNSLPFVGIIAIVTLGMYYGEQTKPTYRDCVALNSSPANRLQIYEQPDRMSKSINYQPTSGKERFWVAKRTADEQWAQLYRAITLFDDLPESAKLGWVSTMNINTLGIVECMTKN
ncbi:MULTISPECIES: hypothetical protein [Providencia]|uniref:hypothetical protein n=1 Tax=Providencia TaxID=586 RepID=UPI00065E7925|nr:hypothetical protein [Providencia rettgeri]